MLENLNPFKWGSEAKESSPSPASSVKKIEQESAFDISVPTFHFTEKEVANFIAEGMTEDEIKLKEKEVINKLARARSGGMAN